MMEELTDVTLGEFSSKLKTHIYALLSSIHFQEAFLAKAGENCVDHSIYEPALVLGHD
jgi:hypothetical protein